MTETDRILQAMLALGEFTVADLVRSTESRPATVRTVLQRHGEKLELVGVDESGHPGGRWKRYRVKGGSEATLDISSARATAPARVAERSLLAAFELLLTVPPIDDDPETVDSIVRRARRFRDTGLEDTGHSTARSRYAAWAVDLLLGLVDGEDRGDMATLVTARNAVQNAKRLLPASGDVARMVAMLERRLAESPLARQRFLTVDSPPVDRARWGDALVGLIRLAQVADESEFVDRLRSFSVRLGKAVGHSGTSVILLRRDTFALRGVDLTPVCVVELSVGLHRFTVVPEGTRIEMGDAKTLEGTVRAAFGAQSIYLAHAEDGGEDYWLCLTFAAPVSDPLLQPLCDATLAAVLLPYFSYRAVRGRDGEHPGVEAHPGASPRVAVDAS